MYLYIVTYICIARIAYIYMHILSKVSLNFRWDSRDSTPFYLQIKKSEVQIKKSHIQIKKGHIQIKKGHIQI